MKTQNELTKVGATSQNPARLKTGRAMSYLQKQFPWFSEGEIAKAIDLKGPHIENVISYLDAKSGTPKHQDDDY